MRKTLRKLELPILTHDGSVAQSRSLESIAISLKRIADYLEEGLPRLRDTLEARDG